uniref:hypothetical protein n=1 Tax=Actinomadura sp. CA-154981 TaxID=3240037 RepID=UPI003F49A57C
MHEAGDPSAAIGYYRDALNHWRTSEWTDPLPDLPGTLTLRRQRELNDRRRAAEGYVDARLDVGDGSLALADDIYDLMLTHQPSAHTFWNNACSCCTTPAEKLKSLAAYWDAGQRRATPGRRPHHQ